MHGYVWTIMEKSSDMPCDTKDYESCKRAHCKCANNNWYVIFSDGGRFWGI